MKILKATKKEFDGVSKMYEKEMKKYFLNIGEKPISAREYKRRLNANFRKPKMVILGEDKKKRF